MHIELTVNNQLIQLEVEPHQTLLEVLREQLGLIGTKEGCSTGHCGACTILLDGKPVSSCLVLAVEADGREMLTIEGLVSGEKLHPLQQAFIDNLGSQCGFCSPGMVLSAVALLEGNPQPSSAEIRRSLAGNLCRCTGYAKIVQSVKAAVSASGQPGKLGKTESSRTSNQTEEIAPHSRVAPIGQRRPRVDAKAKLTGRAYFGSDIPLRGVLQARILHSPYAHAEVLSIDARAARQLPGVRAVLTADDLPAVPGYDPHSRAHAFLARRYALFHGQPVAAVAAEDVATAEAALDLIKVEYRSLPPVVDLLQATRSGSPLVSRSPARRNPEGDWPDDPELPEPGSNIAEQVVYRHGDLEAAWAVSSLVVENTYTVASVHQSYLEPHVVTAWWDTPEHLIAWEPVQGIFSARTTLAQALGIPEPQVEIRPTEIGGGFGGKIYGLYAPLAAWLARLTGAPVRLALTRQEELTSGNPAPHSIIRVKTGADSNGKLTALEAVVWVEAGAFASGWIMSSVATLLKNTYHFPAWAIQGYEVLTNKPSITSYRAPGGPNAAFAIESQIDELSRRLRLDPLQFRMNNLSLENDLQATLDPQPPVGTPQVLQALAEHPAWKTPLPARDSEGWLNGRGLALGMWEGGAGPATALAILEIDGTCRIVTGSVDLTGSYTSLAQIAAAELGISAERIRVERASTATVPFAPEASGSQTIYAMGVAVQMAASDLRQRLLQAALPHLEAASLDDLSIDDQGIFQIHKPEKRINLPELYSLGVEWFATHAPLVGLGSAPLRQRAPGSAACLAEVRVDPQTGKVQVTRLVLVQDTGTAINPLMVEGQIQGGVAQAVGLALWEGLQYDAQGRLLNASLLDYRLPTAPDLPEIEPIIVSALGGDGPFQAKLVGEPSIIPPAAAIANAITAAISRRPLALPMTAESIWRLMAAPPELASTGS